MILRRIAVAVGVLGLLSTSIVAHAGDPAAGKIKANTLCAGCHGAQGEGKGNFPAIKGQAAADLVSAMQAYKSGSRKDPTMNAIFKGMNDEDIENMAAYYSAIK
ncbi:MAG: cytochrome c [Pseudomonadota bacterium]